MGTFIGPNCHLPPSHELETTRNSILMNPYSLKSFLVCQNLIFQTHLLIAMPRMLIRAVDLKGRL